jgi:hypothetical protein
MTQNGSYPSPKRYYAKNPVVSFRLTNEDKKKLEEMASREDMTLVQYVRNYLKGIVEKRETEAKIYKKGRKDGFDNGRKEGLKEGYKNGKEDWAIWFKCRKCGEPCYIEPGDEADEAHKEISTTFIAWGHKSGPEKKGTRNLLLPEGISEFLSAVERTTSSKPDEKNE